MRTDRSGRPLTIVALRFAPGQDRHAAAATWAARVRLTDHVGWLGDGRLGVVLWDTDESAARRFLRSAPDRGGAGPAAGCDIYVYHPAAGSPAAPPEPSVEMSAGDARPLEELLVRPLPHWKRTLDVVGASAGLVALAPLLAATAVAVKATSPGPVFFTQWRNGLGGRPFRLYKFRSMTADAEHRHAELRERNQQDGPAFKMEDDPRITPFGRWVRRTSVDELPQLWNVLRGEMSLVGPRPLPVAETRECLPWQRRRLSVTPGLTCGWQVQDRRMSIPFADWVRMDLRYADRRTVRGDLSLIARTLAAVFGGNRP